MISVLILTRNEEQDLPGCLDSVAWCDDIHILDSESTDRTVAIAATARRYRHHPPLRHLRRAAQRRDATALPLSLGAGPGRRRATHPGALRRDAAGRSPRLPMHVSGFRIRRRDFLWGTWLKHAQLTPYYVRLLRVGHAHYTRDVNEVVEVDGEIRELHSPFDHLAFSKGITHWIAKHNGYSSKEAELLASGNATHGCLLYRALFAGNFHERRVAQKAIFYELPARPLIKWCYMMFVRGPCSTAPAGVMYATLQSFYEFLIEVKHRELHPPARRQAALRPTSSGDHAD